MRDVVVSHGALEGRCGRRREAGRCLLVWIASTLTCLIACVTYRWAVTHARPLCCRRGGAGAGVVRCMCKAEVLSEGIDVLHTVQVGG